MKFLLLPLFLFSFWLSSQNYPALIPYRKKDLWGYCDSAGKIIIRPQYKFCGLFGRFKTAVAGLNDTVSVLINIQGKELLKANTEQFKELNGFVFLDSVFGNYRYALLGADGKRLSSFRYNLDSDANLGSANNLNKNCTIVIADSVQPYYEWNFGLLDAKGKTVLPFIYWKLMETGKENYILIEKKIISRKRKKKTHPLLEYNYVYSKYSSKTKSIKNIYELKCCACEPATEAVWFLFKDGFLIETQNTCSKQKSGLMNYEGLFMLDTIYERIEPVEYWGQNRECTLFSVQKVLDGKCALYDTRQRKFLSGFIFDQHPKYSYEVLTGYVNGELKNFTANDSLIYFPEVHSGKFSGIQLKSFMSWPYFLELPPSSYPTVAEMMSRPEYMKKGRSVAYIYREYFFVEDLGLYEITSLKPCIRLKYLQPPMQTIYNKLFVSHGLYPWQTRENIGKGYFSA
ncbi:MAG: WG repeat-containing protein, partial [Bacteroidia bacterium]|nr:WG repeat-containing protein [Bacteroidia bacterium]